MSNKSRNVSFFWPMTSDDEENDIFMIGDEVMPFIHTINLTVICGALSLFGIVTNIINIVVFRQMGFRETINISLFGLAVSDLFSLVSLLWMSICYNPFFMYSDLPLNSLDLQLMPGGWTHVIFTRITGFITVFITLERCLCIAFPLKIKRMMTPLRVKIIVGLIYIAIIVSMLPNYLVFYFHWQWDPTQNRTVLTVSFKDLRDSFQAVSNYIQMVYPIVSFSSVVICTSIFVWKLNQRGKWLKQSTTAGSQENASAARDQQIIKMVVWVAVIFIVCYVPSLLLFTVLSRFPEMNFGRKYENFFILAYSIPLPLEAINSGVNIIVYFKTMSKYKTIFHSLCLECKFSAQAQAK